MAVYLADGLGHTFLALTDDACMNYLCSEAYVPGSMININSLDPEIGLPSDPDGATGHLREGRLRPPPSRRPRPPVCSPATRAASPTTRR